MVRTIVCVGLAMVIGSVASAQEPSCVNCPGTYIPNTEVEAYIKRGFANDLTDQQIRQTSVGKSNVGIAVVTRKRVTTPNVVAEHDLVSEVYHVISGAGTIELGPDLVGKQRRNPNDNTVRLLNGPGNNAKAIRNGVLYDLKQGDVVIIPAGTGHRFTKVDDHITYLMIRLDPDKVTPPKTEADSLADLKTDGRSTAGNAAGATRK